MIRREIEKVWKKYKATEVHVQVLNVQNVKAEWIDDCRETSKQYFVGDAGIIAKNKEFFIPSFDQSLLSRKHQIYEVERN